MVREGRRSLGQNGNITNQAGNSSGEYEEVKSKYSTAIRVLTVIAYIVGVSTAAALLSAYYVFLWVPNPSEPLQHRPTDSPFSLAQHGAGNSYYHYQNKNSMDPTKHSSSSRGSKKHYKTTLPPSMLPKPQYLVRKNKESSKPTSSSDTRPRY